MLRAFIESPFVSIFQFHRPPGSPACLWRKRPAGESCHLPTTKPLFQELAHRPPGSVQVRQAHLRVFPRQDHAVGAGFEGRKASPDDTYAATFAALKAGAHGVILSRKYSEMRLANLDAAGRAVREFLK